MPKKSAAPARVVEETKESPITEHEDVSNSDKKRKRKRKHILTEEPEEVAAAKPQPVVKSAPKSGGDTDEKKVAAQSKKSKSGKSSPASAASASSASSASSSAAEPNADLQAEIAEHKAQLDALKESDPEFYAHLLETDKDLLDFGGGEADDVDENGEDDDDEEELEAALDAAEEEDDAEPVAADKARKKSSLDELTSESLRKIEAQALNEHSLRALKKLLKIFNAACHSVQSNSTSRKSSGKKQPQKEVDESMQTTHARLHDQVTRFCLKHMDAIFESHVPTETKEGVLNVDKRSSRWTKVGPYVKSYLTNVLLVGPMLVDAHLVRLHIAHLARVRHLFAPFARLPQKLAKVLLDCFSGGVSELVRIDAYLLLRLLALEGSQATVDLLLKQAYLAYVRNAKFYSRTSAPTVQLMMNCVVDLFSLFPRAAYQFAFIYIRQLAIHVRGALLQQTSSASAASAAGSSGAGKTRALSKASSFENVYNWQFMNCLRLFAALLATMGLPDAAAGSSSSTASSSSDRSVLLPLVYPFVQLNLTVIDALPHARFFPLRLLCAELLNQVATATRVYIPLSPYLLPVLQSSQLEKKTQSLIKGKMNSFEFSLHVSKTVLVGKQFQAHVFTEALRLLVQHFAVYAYSVAFPELALPAVLQLKKFCKSTKVTRFAKQAQTALRHIETQIAWVSQRRGVLDASPQSVASVDVFRGGAHGRAPLETYAAQLKRVEHNTNDDDEVSVKHHKNQDDDEDDHEMDDEDDDEVPSAPVAKKPKKAKKKTLKAAVTSNETDEVRDFEFSDDEE